MTKTNDALNKAFSKTDRRLREVLKSYGYAPNNDLVAQLIAATEPYRASDRKRLIERLETEAVGDDEPTFGPQNEAGDISPTDYEIMAANQCRGEIRQRIDIIKREELQGGGE